MLTPKGPHGYQGQGGPTPQIVPLEELFDQGKKVILRRGMGLSPQDGFFTSSKQVREWCMMIQPSVASIDALGAAGVFWNVEAKITSGYTSTSGLRLLRPLSIESAFRVPIFGLAVPIHGSFVQLELQRDVPLAAPQVDVELLIYGLPTVPRPWSYPDLAVLVGAGPFLGSVSVRTFATEFSISGQIDAGDTLDQVSPNGTIIQAGVPVTSDYANFWQPIDPDVSLLRYTSAVSKRLLFNFRYRS